MQKHGITLPFPKIALKLDKISVFNGVFRFLMSWFCELVPGWINKLHSLSSGRWYSFFFSVFFFGVCTWLVVHKWTLNSEREVRDEKMKLTTVILFLKICDFRKPELLDARQTKTQFFFLRVWTTNYWSDNWNWLEWKFKISKFFSFFTKISNSYKQNSCMTSNCEIRTKEAPVCVLFSRE